MAAPAAPVAAIRVAVRRCLREAHLPPGALVMVACSGGADSLALAAATAFVARRESLDAGLVTVDHGLQEGSTARAMGVVAWRQGLGLAPAVMVTVDAAPSGEGPEAAARAARYEGLAAAAKAAAAAVVLLGHTRDDQAETVLLALARGAGVRGLAGMPARREIGGVPFLRPLLGITRAETRAACTEMGLVPWDDPHNEDPRYTRSRVRAAMPLLVELLGADVVPNLARTAGQVAADTRALDGLAVEAGEKASDGAGALRIAVLQGMPEAIRRRVLRGYA